MKRSPLLIICLIGLIDLSSFGLIIPLLSTYAHRFHVTATLLGLMLGSYSLAQFIFTPILGRWSDRIGRRPVLLASVAGSVFAHALLGVADLASSIPLLFAARILDGITGANIATAQAYISDVTSGSDRAKGMGYFGAVLGLGFVIGPALGGGLMVLGKTLAGEWGTSWPAFGAAVISAVAFVMIWRYLPEPEAHIRSGETSPRPRSIIAALHRVARNARIRELMALFTALTLSFVFLEATFVYIGKDRFGLNERTVMFVFAYFGVLMVLVRGGLVARFGLAKQFGEPTLISVGPFISAAGFMLIALSQFIPGQWVLLAACVPIALGTGITEPSMHALLSRQASSSEQGLTLGAAQSLASLMRGVVPVAAGFFYDHSPSLPYWIAGTVYVLAGISAIFIKGQQERALKAT